MRSLCVVAEAVRVSVSGWGNLCGEMSSVEDGGALGVADWDRRGCGMSIGDDV